jgi:hypothetical protein
MAAITTSPWWRWNDWPLSVTGDADAAGVGSARVVRVDGLAGCLAAFTGPAVEIDGLGGDLLREGIDEVFLPGGFDILEEDAVLRALGAGERGLDGAEVELEDIREFGFLDGLVPEETVGLAVGVDEGNGLLIATGEAEVIQRNLIDREEAHGGAVFGGHVGDGGAVRDGECGDALPEELDELVDNTLLAEDLRDGEHQVGGGGAFRQFSLEAEADDLGREHVDGLSEHDSLGLDPPHSPADDTQTVFHSRVRVSADTGIGERDGLAINLAGEHTLGEVLEIDLVDDAGGGRDDGEVGQGLLAPLEELVALVVALELLLGVDGQRGLGSVGIDLHRVVDHQVAGDERIDGLGVAAELLHSVAHRREIDDARDTREILEHDSPGHEGDFLLRRGFRVPVGQARNIVGGDDEAVEVAEHGLQQDADRKGKIVDLADSGPGECREGVVGVGAVGGLEGGAGFEGVGAWHGTHSVGCADGRTIAHPSR